MAKSNKNRIGLTFGIMAALIHLIWAIAVAIGIAQTYLDWIFPMHMIGNVFRVASFSIVNTIILLVMAFISGYILGWVGTWVYEKVK